MDLLRQRAYPLGLLITIPLLSMCIGTFGIALTWLLQKGLTDFFDISWFDYLWPGINPFYHLHFQEPVLFSSAIYPDTNKSINK